MMVAGVLLIALSVMAIVALSVVRNSYQLVSAHEALVVNRMNGATVSFGGMMVLPVVHKAEKMDLRTRLVRVVRTPEDQTLSKSGENVALEVLFYLRVGRTRDDVLRVARAVGCERASQQETIEELFGAQLSEAVKRAVAASSLDELSREGDRALDDILREVGTDLHGYCLEDAVIVRLAPA